MIEIQKTADEILNHAAEILATTRIQSRDSYITVGRLLAEFVLLSLREADNMNEQDRRENSFTRERLIKVAAHRLSIYISRARELLRVAKVVELFGDPGNLSYSSLRVFTPFVRRIKCKIARGRELKPGEVLPSVAEQWEICYTQGRITPVGLYRTAIANNWDSKRIRIEANTGIILHRRQGRRPKVVASTETSSTISLHRIAEQTDPRDLADMIEIMIRACPRTEELKALLKSRI